MSISELRDLVIVIFGFLGIGALLLILLMAFILFRKVSPIVDAARGVLTELRGTSRFVSGTLVQPVIKMASLAMGAKKTLSFLARASRRKGEKKGG